MLSTKVSLTNSKHYAGIGSRTTPPSILKEIRTLAKSLAKYDWILRSGGAKGADTAFEEGCDSRFGAKEIYLPWKGFNNNSSPLYHVGEDCLEHTLSFHPNPRTLVAKPHVHKLMARNCTQVVGGDLGTPVSMVVCWTLDGVENGEETTVKTGGTGQAIRIATAYDIPVFNLKNNDALEAAVDFAVQCQDNLMHDNTPQV